MALGVAGDRYDSFRSVAQSTKAEILIKKGMYEEAKPLLSDYLVITTKLGEPMGSGFYHFLAGKIATETGELAKAEKDYLLSIQSIRRAGRPYYISYSLYEYGMLLKKMDRDEEAEQKISEAKKIAADINAGQLLKLMENEG